MLSTALAARMSSEPITAVLNTATTGAPAISSGIEPSAGVAINQSRQSNSKAGNSSAWRSLSMTPPRSSASRDDTHRVVLPRWSYPRVQASRHILGKLPSGQARFQAASPRQKNTTGNALKPELEQQNLRGGRFIPVGVAKPQSTTESFGVDRQSRNSPVDRPTGPDQLLLDGPVAGQCPLDRPRGFVQEGVQRATMAGPVPLGSLECDGQFARRACRIVHAMNYHWSFTELGGQCSQLLG